MRILRFIANGQMLEPDPECDFTGLVSGTSGYLHAEFEFDNDWIGSRVAASFFSLDKEYPAIVENGVCEIPAEALSFRDFYVQLTGIRDGYKITTNRQIVRQRRPGE